MTQEKVQNVHVGTETFVCNHCGGTIKFNIASQKFTCSSCKTEQSLETLSDTIIEYDFSKYLEREKASVPFEGMAVVVCQNCGLEITLSESQIAATCPMCASTQIASAKQHAGIAPEGVIPFQIDKHEAQKKFRTWVKSRWFAPNDFKKKYGEGALNGMYLPFWTYDASVLSRYKGEGGKYRQVKNKDGKEETVTDWYPVSGVVTSFFDDVQVCASEKEKNIKGILPYNTVHDAKAYSPGYLSGYYAEIYKIKADTAFESAKKIMEAQMRDLAREKILSQYDTARVQSIDTTYSGVTYKHMLLPMWSSAYGYKSRTYSYLVNGETGKVSGQRPYSPAKIASAVICGIIALILAVMLLSGGEEGEQQYQIAGLHQVNISAFISSEYIREDV